MSGMFSIQPHSSFFQKSSHVFILFKRNSTVYFHYVCKQKQSSISSSSERWKNIRLDCWEIKTLYLIFQGERELCIWLPLFALCLSEGNKEFKEKSQEQFFKKSSHFFPLSFSDYDVGRVSSWKSPLQKSALSASFQSFDRWLEKAELWLKELTDGLSFQKSWNRFMEIAL